MLDILVVILEKKNFGFEYIILFFFLILGLNEYIVFFHKIVMEYCGAGSVCDIMQISGKTLNEKQISSVVKDTLRGLEYLHNLKQIHRDIKVVSIFQNFLKEYLSKLKLNKRQEIFY